VYARADTHYVGGPWPGGPPPYTSPETAAYYPEEGIEAADPGDTVVFLPGWYGSPDRPIEMRAGVSIIGSGPDNTFILTDILLAARVTISGFRVVNSTMLMYDLSAAPPADVVMTDCVLDGAWIAWTYPQGSLSVARCLFLDTWRSAAVSTWGVDVFRVSQCAFIGGPYSGAGGISFSEGQRGEISHCLFDGCSNAVGCWGALELRVTHSTFLSNKLALNLWVRDALVENCTFFANEHDLGVANEPGVMARVRNSILWASRSGPVSWAPDGGPPPVEISFSNVQGGYPGRGNIDADPMFFLPSGDQPDLHLCAFSPCIDAGDPFSDYRNEPEPNGGRVNMGAYGNTWEATTSELVDTDGDNIRDDWEMASFGSLARDGSADADGDRLADRQEYRHLSDPSNPDSDGDGLGDGEEVFDFLTDPIVADTDNDGTPDGKEVAQGTNPLDSWDAFTVIKFWIEDNQIHVVHPVQPRWIYNLESSFWPNGPFGTLCGDWEGRYGALTHTFIEDLNPHTHFFRVLAHPRP
jgi:hypothetical protein